MTHQHEQSRKQITLERTYRATAQRVWELWTTRSGIESWWGPDGFDVLVKKLDLRPGGELHYTMTATAPAQVEFLTKAGIPLASDVVITYTEVQPTNKLAYITRADFVPGVATYGVNAIVEFATTDDEVHMTLTFDAMHDEQWTRNAVLGHESELAKLDKLLS